LKFIILFFENDLTENKEINFLQTKNTLLVDHYAISNAIAFNFTYK